MTGEQQSLTGVAIPLCGHVAVEAEDRTGSYRLMCTRRPHGDDIDHSYTWLTEPARIDPVVLAPGDVL